jgi:ABC-2 type transport system ATP-binding protein
MRRRLDLGASLVGQPRVLFLDEPTTGLDPRSRRRLWDFIELLIDGGTTLLLTTQYLEEADRLANRIGVIDGGRVIAEGTSDELKSRVGGDVLELEVDEGTDLAEAARALDGMGCDDCTLDEENSTIRLPVDDAVGTVTEAVRRMDAAGIALIDIAIHRPTLDDVFLTLTGHHVEPEPAAAGNGGKRRRRRSRR